MTDLEDVIKQLERRRAELEELIDEYRRVLGALEALQGVAPPVGPHHDYLGSVAKRARRGERRSQILEVLRRNPGTNARDIALQLGTNTANISTQLRNLEKQGRIVRGPDGYCVPV
ncbi:MAG: FaeA-like protein [Thermoleophilaceae bacterium]|jgi:predicted Rossmann fold nucleotide-binding protein DprA/Smf involved in DNA uptake|nr:FaeA-like protein [Thermoleophilaceae bacterium]